MQQNMAKQKGGGPRWMPKPRPAPAKTLAPKTREPAPPTDS